MFRERLVIVKRNYSSIVVVISILIVAVGRNWRQHPIRDIDYKGSVKEADMTFLPLVGLSWTKETEFPSAVVESGWNECCTARTGCPALAGRF